MSRTKVRLPISIPNVQVNLFGQTVDALTGFATIDTATKRLEPDGTAHSFGRGHVSADVAIAGNVFNEEFTQLGPPLQGGFPRQTFPIPLPTIPLPLPPPFTASIEPKVALAYEVPVALELNPTGFSTTIAPQASADGSLKVAGGLGGFGFGVTAGLEGTLTLATVQLPLTGNLNWSVDRTPLICEASLNGNLTIGVKVTVLDGRLDFVVSISVPFLGSFDIFSQNIANPEGFDLLNPPPLQLASFDQDVFDLDPSQCRFGALTCATVATLNASFPNASFPSTFDVDTGLVPLGAAYGQAACEDQYLVDVDLTQPSLQGRTSS